jgi:hypothetical protein
MPQKLPFNYNHHGAFEGYPIDIEELIKACPKKFYEINDWTIYAQETLIKRAENLSNWAWKSEDKIQQYLCLLALVNEPLEYKHKIAIISWMLSEMLLNVPE